MDTFKSELATDFRVELEGKHVVPKHNFLAMNMVTGPNGVLLNAGYKNAETFQFKDEIGMIVERACHLVPHGLLVFFPSYRLKESVVERWKSTDQWDNLNEMKPVFEEPKGSNRHLFEEVMTEFEECIEGGGGAVLLAVCRGKVSEGVDFANNAARAVITIGLPFPNWKSLEVKDKRDYNDRHCKELNLLSGQDWYTIQAFRAINQALGRCLRHINDWGAIIMIESRIAGNDRYRKNISRWIRDELISVARSDEAFDRLEVFCTEKERETEKLKREKEEEEMKSEKEEEEIKREKEKEEMKREKEEEEMKRESEKENRRNKEEDEKMNDKEKEQDPLSSPKLKSRTKSSSASSDTSTESEGMLTHNPYPPTAADPSPLIPLFSHDAAPPSPDTKVKRNRDSSSGSETESPDEDVMTVTSVGNDISGVSSYVSDVKEPSPRNNRHGDMENHNINTAISAPTPSHLNSPMNVAKRPRLSRIKPAGAVASTAGDSSPVSRAGPLPGPSSTPVHLLDRYYKCQRCQNQIIRSCVTLCCKPPCGNISIKGLIKGSYYLGTVPSPQAEITFRTESKDRPGCSSLGCFRVFCAGCKKEVGTVEFLFGSAYVGGAVKLNYF